jgi:hypothetical protein
MHMSSAVEGTPGQISVGRFAYDPLQLKEPSSSFAPWLCAVSERVPAVAEVIGRPAFARMSRIEAAEEPKDDTPAKDFLDGTWARRTDTFVFATRVAAVRSDRAEAVEAARIRLEQVGVLFEMWDGELLSEMLHSLPELVDKFFGRDATRLFCGEEAAQQLAGRDHARSILDGLATRLRERTRGVLTSSTGDSANDTKHGGWSLIEARFGSGWQPCSTMPARQPESWWCTASPTWASPRWFSTRPSRFGSVGPPRSL